MARQLAQPLLSSATAYVGAIESGASREDAMRAATVRSLHRRFGVRTGIGTDSHGLNFVSELRTAGFFSKLHFKQGHVASAYQLVNAGTLVGADALKRPDLGRLVAGAKADLLVFDLFKAHLQPVWDPLKNVIWKGSSADIALVMVHGKPVVREGKLLTADEGAIIRNASTAARKIWAIAADQGILTTPAV